MTKAFCVGEYGVSTTHILPCQKAFSRDPDQTHEQSWLTSRSCKLSIMTLRLRSLWLLVAPLLAACSSADTKSAVQPTKADAGPLESPVPLSSNAPTSDQIPGGQRDYFVDGKVTLAEYQTAYARFVECATDAGIGDDVREQARDPLSGLITYSTQTLLLPPGQSDGTKLNDCYQSWFAHTEAAFQTSDPTVVAQIPKQQMDYFNQNIRPCLETIGVEVPADLQFNDENWAQLNDEATRAFQDGRCGKNASGG